MRVKNLIIGLVSFVFLMYTIGCTNNTASEFTVNFLKDGEIVHTEVVQKGEDAVGIDVVKEGHEFVGWDHDITNVQKDLDVNAVFQAYVYKVSFYNEKGILIEYQFIEYGQSAVAPEMSDKENSFFKGWDNDFSCVKEDMKVNAVYQNKCTIEFYDGDVKLNYELNSFLGGEIIELPVPTKEGHEFIGWFLSDISLTPYYYTDDNFNTDITFYARWVQTEQTSTLELPESTYKFVTINKNKMSNSDAYVYQPVLPSGATSGVTNYNWTTSDSSIATVSMWSSITPASAGYCILTATLIADPSITINCVMKVTSDGVFVSSEEEANEFVLCNVTFMGKDNDVIGTAKCQKNGSVIYPVPKSYDGYKFVGWDTPNYNITEDVVISAIYEEGVNNYQGKSFAVIGDSISTYKQYIPDGFSAFYPYPTADVSDVNMTWWMQTINNVGGTLFVNNSYSGTCVGDSSSFATQNKSRLEYTLLSGVAPDVILIYMGSNDCASQYVSLLDFTRGYKKMIDNLQSLCPNSEIILCTLATSPFYSVEEQTSFNDVITNYGKEYNLTVFDLSSVNLEGKLVDSAHPSVSGMNVFADKMTELLMENKAYHL